MSRGDPLGARSRVTSSSDEQKVVLHQGAAALMHVAFFSKTGFQSGSREREGHV